MGHTLQHSVFQSSFAAFISGMVSILSYPVKMPWLTLLVAVLIPVVVYGLVSYLVLSACLKSDIVPLLRSSRRRRKKPAYAETVIAAPAWMLIRCVPSG